MCVLRMNVMIQVIQSRHFPGAGSVMMFNSRPRFSSSRSSRDSRLALSSSSPIFSLRSPSSATCSVGSMSGARRVSAAAIAASAAATTLAPFSNRVEPVCEEMEITSTRVSFWCRERAKRVRFNQRRAGRGRACGSIGQMPRFVNHVRRRSVALQRREYHDHRRISLVI